MEQTSSTPAAASSAPEVELGAGPIPSQPPTRQEMAKKPLVILVVGMAGTGKTTLVHRLQHHSVENNLKSYFVNMDPAVFDVPFNANIDICDTVNYKAVMEQYKLGPNGGIMTALNLFATKIDQVIDLIAAKGSDIEYVIVDTPGQIEVFTWSASGQLIMEAFASTFPTCVLFAADAVRCSTPSTFMSTMIYSCSIMFKAQLPLLVVLNKCDIADVSYIEEWMRDPEELWNALKSNDEYSSTLTQSLSTFLGEYYEGLHAVGCSAVTGEGINALFPDGAFDKMKEEYLSEFLPMVEARYAEKQAAREKEAQRSLAKFDADKKKGAKKA